MKASNLTREELLKENRRLIKNLRSRIGRIEELDLKSPIYAQSKFQELMKNTPSKISDLDTKELQTLYRDLKYISSLKSATLRGAREVAGNYEPIREKMSVFSKELQGKVWEIYGKMYDKIGQVKYKYTIMDTIIDIMFSGEDTEKIVHDLTNLYDEAYRSVGGARATSIELQNAVEQAFTLYSNNLHKYSHEDWD